MRGDKRRLIRFKTEKCQSFPGLFLTINMKMIMKHLAVFRLPAA
jgi:hypothetical protein